MSDYWEHLREDFDFASTVRLNFHAALLEDFIRQVLRMDPAWTLVSDESSLDDFPEPVAVYAERIKATYGVNVTVLTNLLLATILEAITAQRVSQQ